MKKLNSVIEPPHYFSWHENIVNSKHTGESKTALQEISVNVGLRYTVLKNNVSNKTIQSITINEEMQENSQYLLDCYKNKSKKTKAIFEKIKSVQSSERTLSFCPYCGVTLPNTHDHYLPAEIFPEFSVHPLNLVPCCSNCNSSKGMRWLEGGRRLFLHFYSDEVSSNQYLHVQLHQRPDALGIGAKFYISENVPQDLSADEWELVRSHYTKLLLIDRYNKEVNSEISSIFDVCRSHLASGGPDVASFLNNYSANEAGIYGVNYWRVVLMRELANSAEFIDKVEESAH
ncbi:hypothetical protein Q7A_1850 [Methylophaga nitratireducenticrescens]|uniref:HNH endonuclease n=1 Tax=Methylophaga nitratireducenticrescens TaxID=754476 RepID=I1XJU9_METNJ|nr:HNH endonuclease [Methylophaga nitratireducenticrescens]AFI84668.1 hypothetical protein Q7A_1850 [Methylophaga nitratireducenticrescens]